MVDRRRFGLKVLWRAAVLQVVCSGRNGHVRHLPGVARKNYSNNAEWAGASTRSVARHSGIFSPQRVQTFRSVWEGKGRGRVWARASVRKQEQNM
jgi:hypothetical protein